MAYTCQQGQKHARLCALVIFSNRAESCPSRPMTIPGSADGRICAGFGSPHHVLNWNALHHIASTMEPCCILYTRADCREQWTGHACHCQNASKTRNSLFAHVT